MNNLYVRTSFKKQINIEDYCNECNANMIIECCNRCGNGICQNDDCSTIFPHHKNSVFAICRTCYVDIDRRLTLQIDIDKLRILKKNIRSNRIQRITNKK